LARTLTDGSEVNHVLDTTLIPAIVRVRASRKGLFAGQATFGRCVSKTEWVYGFKVALSVTPEGLIAAFGLAEANFDERPIGGFLLTSDGHDAFLADNEFSSIAWEKHWLEEHGALVAATPQKSARREASPVWNVRLQSSTAITSTRSSGWARAVDHARATPAAPPAQPNPQTGMRLRLGLRPSLKSSFASRLGVEMPVVETKKSAPTSSDFTPARSSARLAAFSESSSACSTYNAFLSGNDHSRPYHPSGWQK
jgi:hypothetical protein